MLSSRSFAFIVTVAVAFGSAHRLSSQEQSRTAQAAPTTTAIVFGLGSPNINAERSGTSIGVAAGGTLYLFDAGAGVERRIMEAAPKLAAQHVARFGPVFLTHLDPDHTVGLAALL
jgi:glyoxylase-like metal-dependent hydrolase (beta-lactamase superfamily II)